ncbi:hypothetical protein BC628DRAFT_1327261 [Trametes gibbosa]|nr:hypothetical protein BC628DRAFT_1327261 [Trametes gibbosa]
MLLTPYCRGRSSASSENMLAVSNLYDGFDIYNLSTQSHVRTFQVTLSVNLPLPVLLASDGSECVFGSSSGEVRIVDPTSAQELQILNHDGELVGCSFRIPQTNSRVLS